MRGKYQERVAAKSAVMLNLFQQLTC